ncbi:MAG TPA: DUF1579 domain-containing protein [Chitinophagales bacterium]|nr:DUF1579 domain-containing protein [Chitinophagales bacterium]
MKKFHNMICLALICFIVTNARAQDPKQQAAMQAWTDYATPGQAQKMMAQSAGDWKAEVTQYMDPTQAPMKSSALVHNEMIMGDRYLSTRYTGNMMGMPFEGLGTMGFDNGSQKYCSTWIDNMSTGIGYLEGMISADGKTLELKGKSYDPMQKKEVAMRQVIHFNGDKDQTMEFYKDMNGKEIKVMEIHLTR